MPLLRCFVAPSFVRDEQDPSSCLRRNPHRHFPHFHASSATYAAPGSSKPAFRQRLGRTACVATRADETLTIRGIFQNAYIGYYIDVRYKQQGLTREAVRLALDTAFGPLGLHRVQAAIMPHNHASLALVRSVGFRLEGVAERYLKIAGDWRDHCFFAMTADEWKTDKPIR